MTDVRTMEEIVAAYLIHRGQGLVAGFLQGRGRCSDHHHTASGSDGLPILYGGSHMVDPDRRIVQSLFRDGFMRVGAYFGDTVEAMCLGELGQMEYRGREDITVDQYMSNIYGKTAALCRLACVAGAVESGCSDEVTSQLEQLGLNFGYMFQIRDDLLDFISTSAEEGKPTQVDFREGIYTLPVIYAMQDGQYRPRIIRLMQLAKKGGFGAAEEEELKALVVDSGGLAHASTDMKIYAQKAMRAVENLPDHGVSTVFRELLHKNM